MGVQKHLFVSERAILKELLKQRTNVRSCTGLLYSVRRAAALKILLIDHVRYIHIQEFNVQRLEAFFSRLRTLRGRSSSVDNLKTAL